MPFPGSIYVKVHSTVFHSRSDENPNVVIIVREICCVVKYINISPSAFLGKHFIETLKKSEVHDYHTLSSIYTFKISLQF